MGHEMKQSLRTFYIAIAVTSVAAPQRPASGVVTKLSGKVTGGVQHRLLAGAGIKIAKADGTVVSQTQTESDGTYEAKGLAPRLYHVTYSKEDYAPEERDVTPTIQIDVDLTESNVDVGYWQSAPVVDLVLADGCSIKGDVYLGKDWTAVFSPTVSSRVPMRSVQAAVG